MTQFPWKKLHFTGIAGAGMAGMARILLEAGLTVSGSDLESNKITESLIELGASISKGHSEELPKNTEILIYSSAVRPENPERLKATELNIPQIQRGVFLAEMAKYFETVIAIGGSHGKTTITAMIAWIFSETGQEPAYMIGGKPSGNFPQASFGKGKILITEVDESDGTLAHMHSTIAIVPNAEEDHSWSAGGESSLKDNFRQFAKQAKKVLYGATPENKELFADFPHAEEISLDSQIPVPQIGAYNRFNAYLAGSASGDAKHQLGKASGNIEDVKALISFSEATKVLSTFPGVERRCSLRLKLDNLTILEDYAHHPTELHNFISAMKQDYADHRKVVIFQPHRFERVEKYAEAFGQELKAVDRSFVTEPFGAWTARQDKPNTKKIADLAGQNSTFITTTLPKNADCKSALPANDWQEIAQKIYQTLKEEETDKPTLIVVMGAGTVNKILPFLKAFFIEEALAGSTIVPMVNSFEEAEKTLALITHTDLTWRDLTTLGIGSQVPLVIDVQSTKELQSIRAFCTKHSITHMPLGLGSNMVGTDQTFDGIILRFKGELEETLINGNTVTAGAGVKLVRFVRQIAKADLVGGEALIAIPGAIGGAIRMNAGAQGIETSDFLISIQGVLPDGTVWHKKADEINWHYRGSDIPWDVIITQATFHFETGNGAEALKAIDKVRTFRKDTQPGGRNPGCSFRNPVGDAAGRLIDKHGLKGLQFGQCTVSPKHANFLVNEGQGSEKDFSELIREVQRQVFNKTGIILENEVKFAGDIKVNAVKPLKIAVLKGGPSSEREISLESAAAVSQALRDGGHQVTEIDITDFTLPEIPSNIDVVFPVLHGIFGEDGQVQKILEKRETPYVGCQSTCGELTISKFKTNELLRQKGLPVANSIMLTEKQSKLPEGIELPFIVKPVSQGSTVGMSLVKAEPDFAEALEKAFAVDHEVLIEEFIKGQESTCGVIFDQVLPVIEIIPPGEIFDFDAKYLYSKGETQYLCPPENLSDELQLRMQKLAKEVFEICDCRDISRVDFLYRPEDDQIFILEVNTLPGFTANSLLPKSARIAGINFVELCCSLAKTAWERG